MTGLIFTLPFLALVVALVLIWGTEANDQIAAIRAEFDREAK